MILTNKQKAAFTLLFDFKTEYIGYGGAAGGGKTILGCYWLMMFGFYAPNTRYFIGRDNIKETRDSVLRTWRKVSHMIGFYEWTDKGDRIVFDNGSEVDFLDLSFYPLKDPMYERLGSKEYTAGWIEEAGAVHPMAFEVLKSRIGRWYNDEYNIKKKILVTFNPKKNWVDTTFYRPFANNQETKDTKFIYALPTDNPHLPDDYLDSLRKIKDRATRERLLNGNFDYDDDPSSLIQYNQIEALWTNTHIKKTGKRFIISDIARFGSDRAIITVWDGLVLIEKVIFPTSSTVDIQNTINALRAKHQIPANNVLADEDGVGGGVVDNCKIKGFINNGRPLNPHYQNIKSECGYKLSEIIDSMYIECDLSPKEIEDIKTELGQLKTYDSDKDGKLRILPKEKIKANIGRSPDWLDIFIMRARYELKIERGTTKFIAR